MFIQNAWSAKEWQGPKGESTLRSKDNGDGIMVSSFTGSSFRFVCKVEVSQKHCIRSSPLEEEMKMQQKRSIITLKRKNIPQKRTFKM